MSFLFNIFTNKKPSTPEEIANEAFDVEIKGGGNESESESEGEVEPEGETEPESDVESEGEPESEGEGEIESVSEDNGEGEEEVVVEPVAQTNAVQAINHVLESVNDGLININAFLSNSKKKSAKHVNGNISGMFEYQDSKMNDKTYNEYLTYLKTYYEKSSRKNKQSAYTKRFEDGKMILIDKAKGSQIKITPSVVVDLYHYKDMLEQEVHNTLFQIVSLVKNHSMTNEEDKAAFQKWKSAYITFRKQLDDIDHMENMYHEKITKSEEELATYAIQLNILHEERAAVYSKIRTHISQSFKEQLIILFKEAGYKMPSIDIISNIAKEKLIPIEDVEHWLTWIEKSYLYISAQKKYSEVLKSYNHDINNHEDLMKNYILQKPVLEFL